MVSELPSNKYSFTAKVTALLLSRGLDGGFETVQLYEISWDHGSRGRENQGSRAVYAWKLLL